MVPSAESAGAAKSNTHATTRKICIVCRLDRSVVFGSYYVCLFKRHVVVILSLSCLSIIPTPSFPSSSFFLSQRCTSYGWFWIDGNEHKCSFKKLRKCYKRYFVLSFLSELQAQVYLGLLSDENWLIFARVTHIKVRELPEVRYEPFIVILYLARYVFFI